MSSLFDSTLPNSIKNQLQVERLANLLASPVASDRLLARGELDQLKDAAWFKSLDSDFQAAHVDTQYRLDLVSVFAESSSQEVVKTLVTALGDPCEQIRYAAARGLAKRGTPALRAVLTAIASKPHGEHFYKAAHQAIYLLQFQAPLRDRQAITELLRIIVGPNAQSLAPSVACDALGN